MPLEHLTAHDAAIDIALGIDANALSPGVLDGDDSESSMKAVTEPSRALPTRMPFLIPGSSCAPVSRPPDSESAT